MRRKDIVDAVTQCAEADKWYVSVNVDRKKNIVIFEFSKFTPAGQDFSFTATMKGNCFGSLVADMEYYYEGFDVDEEAYIWLGSDGHGRNGAPFHMRDVLEDMEAAEKMIEQLIDAIRALS